MNYELSDRAGKLASQLDEFMQRHVFPVEKLYHEQVEAADNRWSTPPLMADLKTRAKEEGLWNLFIPGEHDKHGGAGLSNLEYAPLAELMGRVLWSSEIFNCSAPDTGNMEVLMKYATPAQQERWLLPLLAGDIRSSYAMTEPAVASSDATNIECSILRDGDDYIVNGRKWFITGAMHANCEILIVMGKSDPDNPNRHLQQSQILVPRDTRVSRLPAVCAHWAMTTHPLAMPKSRSTMFACRQRTSCLAKAADSRLHRADSDRDVSTIACASSAARSGRWSSRANA